MNKYNEMAMLIMIPIVMVMGLVAAIMAPVQLALKGDVIGCICTGLLSLFIYSILGCFAWAGHLERKHEKEVRND